MAKVRNVTNEFLRVKRFIKIPLLPIGIMFGVIYFECDSYGKSTKIDKKYCNTDWFALNIDFLKNHTYYTKFAQENWQKLKELNLESIEEKLQNQL